MCEPVIMEELIPNRLFKDIRKNPFCFQSDILPDKGLKDLRQNILNSKYLAVNNLNRDFVSTRGYSVVFRRTALEKVLSRFPYFKNYIDLALDPDCNAFYLNPLILTNNSRVDPHIDRSLRSYLKTIDPPALVSVLYVLVPENMEGGELVIANHKKKLGDYKPVENSLLLFQGHLTHSVNPVKASGNRISLVCEQYLLNDEEMEQVPEFTIESRKLKY